MFTKISFSVVTFERFPNKMSVASTRSIASTFICYSVTLLNVCYQSQSGSKNRNLNIEPKTFLCCCFSFHFEAEDDKENFSSFFSRNMSERIPDAFIFLLHLCLNSRFSSSNTALKSTRFRTQITLEKAQRSMIHF